MALGIRLRNTSFAPKASARCVRPVLCQAKAEQSSSVNFIALPVVTLVTAAMMSSAILPLDAFASNSSGGRVGVSTFAARRSSPPAQSHSAPSTTTQARSNAGGMSSKASSPTAAASRAPMPSRSSSGGIMGSKASKPTADSPHATAPVPSHSSSIRRSTTITNVFIPSSRCSENREGYGQPCQGTSPAPPSSYSSLPAFPTQNRTVTTIYSAPSVVVAPVVAPSPFGFGGFGFGGGYGYNPAPIVSVPVFGGLLQLFALVLLASALFGVVRAFFSSRGKSGKKDDTWGDL